MRAKGKVVSVVLGMVLTLILSAEVRVRAVHACSEHCYGSGCVQHSHSESCGESRTQLISYDQTEYSYSLCSNCEGIKITGGSYRMCNASVGLEYRRASYEECSVCGDSVEIGYLYYECIDCGPVLYTGQSYCKGCTCGALARRMGENISLECRHYQVASTGGVDICGKCYGNGWYAVKYGCGKSEDVYYMMDGGVAPKICSKVVTNLELKK